MTPERRREIETLVEKLNLRSPEERAALLASTDPELRTEVETLVSSGQGPTLLRHPAVAGVEPLPGGPAGQRFGPYRVTGAIGRGGMSTVYLGVRDDRTYDKQVAIKVLHLGMETPEAMARFRLERQILARLEHPNIAHLIDGGETPAGLPYIVLEYVEGEPITDYCGRHNLPPGDRLRLFLEVCKAVEFAHRNLIVHRDLKPANILVTPGGTVKLLDFGIAKLLDTDASRTMTIFQAMTPNYASPEQVRGQFITTASDVYSLGVVLYEMLTGNKPYSIPTMTPIEIDRIVCEVEPAPPRVSEDLDNVLLMALRKEPARRYSSVRQFAEDIERSLAHRPVLARPDTLRYRAAKFVRRNWYSLAAAAVTLAAVIVGSSVALYQGRLAQQRFQQVRKLAHVFVFDLHDEVAKLAGSTRAREIMVRTALEYLDNLAASAGQDLELQREIASAYVKVGNAEGVPTFANLGKTGEALASYRKAGDLFESIASRNRVYLPDLAAFYNDFSLLFRLTGDLKSARERADSAVKVLDRVSASQPSAQNENVQLSYAKAYCALGDIDETQNHNRQAWDEFTRCNEVAQALLSIHRSHDTLVAAQAASERLGTSAAGLGFLTKSLQACNENEALIGELLKLEPLNPRFHRLQAILQQFRSNVYYDDTGPSLDDPSQCLVYSRRYLDFVREMVRKDPADVSARVSLAIALFRLSYPLRESDPAEAVKVARESLQTFDELLAGGKREYLVTSRRIRAERRLGEALLKSGQIQESLKTLEPALRDQELLAAHTAPDSQENILVILTLISMSEAQMAAGRWESAGQLLQEARQMAVKASQNSRDSVVSLIPLSRTEQALGSFYSKRGKREEARACYQRLAALWKDSGQTNEYAEMQRVKANRLLASMH